MYRIQLCFVDSLEIVDGFVAAVTAQPGERDQDSLGGIAFGQCLWIFGSASPAVSLFNSCSV